MEEEVDRVHQPLHTERKVDRQLEGLADVQKLTEIISLPDDAIRNLSATGGQEAEVAGR